MEEAYSYIIFIDEFERTPSISSQMNISHYDLSDKEPFDKEVSIRLVGGAPLDQFWFDYDDNLFLICPNANKNLKCLQLLIKKTPSKFVCLFVLNEQSKTCLDLINLKRYLFESQPYHLFSSIDHRKIKFPKIDIRKLRCCHGKLTLKETLAKVPNAKAVRPQKWGSYYVFEDHVYFVVSSIKMIVKYNPANNAEYFLNLAEWDCNMKIVSIKRNKVNNEVIHALINATSCVSMFEISSWETGEFDFMHIFNHPMHDIMKVENTLSLHFVINNRLNRGIHLVCDGYRMIINHKISLANPTDANFANDIISSLQDVCFDLIGAIFPREIALKIIGEIY